MVELELGMLPLLLLLLPTLPLLKLQPRLLHWLLLKLQRANPRMLKQSC